MKLYNYKIVREKSETYYDARKNLNNPIIAAKLFREYYEENFDMDKEHFSIIMVDSKNKIIGFNLVSMGTINQSLVHPREVFRPAIIAAARSIFICHNHPSGDPTPSEEDIDITQRLKEVGKILGIEVLDHIILGDDRFKSLLEMGKI